LFKIIKNIKLKIMKKLIATVQCDECSWKKENENIFDWLDKKCPACQKSVIINKADIAVAENILALEEAKIISLVKEDVIKIKEGKENGIILNINTNKLRK